MAAKLPDEVQRWTAKRPGTLVVSPRGHLLARLRQRYSVTLQTSFPGVRLYRLGPAAPTTP
jgi:hypothetical protein